MHTFLDNFHQCGNILLASHQADLRREGNFTDQKSLSISSLQSDYLNIDSSSGCGKNSEKEICPRQNARFMEVPTILQKIVSK